MERKNVTSCLSLDTFGFTPPQLRAGATWEMTGTFPGKKAGAGGATWEDVCTSSVTGSEP